jgi:hypothetical protein
MEADEFDKEHLHLQLEMKTAAINELKAAYTSLAGEKVCFLYFSHFCLIIFIGQINSRICQFTSYFRIDFFE